MDKIDILIGFLGVVSYFAILAELRMEEKRIALFEAIEERKRKQAELDAERRRAELAAQRTVEEKTKKIKSTMLQEL